MEIITPVKAKRRNTANDYVNNKKFYAAIVERRPSVVAAKEAGVLKPKITRYLGECVLMISQKLATKGNFSGYTYRDEMVSDAIENMIMYFDSFDPDKSNNPFAYFTQIAKFAFIRRIQKEKKQAYIRMKVKEKSIIFDELVESGDEHFDTMGISVLNIDYEKLDDLERSLKINKPKKVVPMDEFLEAVDEAVV